MGRTGTHSLKVALEQLLGAPCYHMVEVFEHPEHVAVWKAAALGEPVDWDSILKGYAAAVDWPAASFWQEISAQYPEAIVVFSRRDPVAWWESASSTIFANFDAIPNAEWKDMIGAVFQHRFTTAIDDREACIAAYCKHEDEVLTSAPKNRLVVWEAKDGWGPICQALELPQPSHPFPVTNTKEQFLAMVAERRGARE